MSHTYWDLKNAEDGAPIVPKKAKKEYNFNPLDTAKLELIRLQCKLETEKSNKKIDKDEVKTLTRVITGKKKQIIGLL